MADQPYDELQAVESGGMDDRLQSLAREAEPLVVLAGPQAARARGERRRARRRVAAAGVVAALALGVGGWQLLPRLDASGGTRTAPPAASTAPDPDIDPDASANALLDRMTDGLLPPSSLPYAAKWRWAVSTADAVTALPEDCGVPPLSEAIAQVSRSYQADALGAEAYEQVFAFPDTDTAVTRAGGLIKGMGPKCGMAFTGSARGSLDGMRALGSAGASKLHTGVSVWVQSEGRYLAVLVIHSPKSPLIWVNDQAPDEPRPAGCMAATLDLLVLGTQPASPPSAPAKDGSAPTAKLAAGAC